MRFIRNKIQSLFKSREKTIKPFHFSEEMLKNPYLQSKALWNDMYGDLENRYLRNQWVVLVLTAVIAFAMIGLIIIAGEVKVKSVPFIVHGNDLITISDESESALQSIQPKMAIYFIKQFIRDVRSVSVDSDVNDNHRIASYSLLTGSAVQVLKDFYERNDPNDLISHHTKDVTITSLLPASAHAMNVRWREDSRDIHTGEIIKSEKFIAEINYQFMQPSANETVLKNNPLGFYITYFSWALDQNN